MSLYRGFVVELSESATRTDEPEASDGTNADMHNKGDAKEVADDMLMLKMKFLPYMVRTFGCRNGLAVLKNEGTNRFISYTNNLLSKWGISDDAQRTWKPFFRAWAKYASARLLRQLPDERNLPQLSSSCYLDHLKRFTRKYEGGDTSIWRTNKSYLPKSKLLVVDAPL